MATENAGPNLGGLGGLASLAGVSLPSSSSGDFLTFKFLLKSEEVAAQIQNEQLAQAIFASDGMATANLSQASRRTIYALYSRTVKKLLTGQDAKDYIPPNAARLSDWLKKDGFSSSEDRDTGFSTFSAETPKPDLMIQVMSR